MRGPLDGLLAEDDLGVARVVLDVDARACRRSRAGDAVDVVERQVLRRGRQAQLEQAARVDVRAAVGALRSPHTTSAVPSAETSTCERACAGAAPAARSASTSTGAGRTVNVGLSRVGAGDADVAALRAATRRSRR